MIVESGESEIYFSEDLLKKNLLDISDSELMNIKSYTSDFEKMEVEKDKLIQKLLNSNGYVNHQLNWWSDMLRIKDRVNGTCFKAFGNSLELGDFSCNIFCLFKFSKTSSRKISE